MSAKYRIVRPRHITTKKLSSAVTLLAVAAAVPAALWAEPIVMGGAAFASSVAAFARLKASRAEGFVERRHGGDRRQAACHP